MINAIIEVKHNEDRQTVSARSLWEWLEVETPFRIWFPRMCEYGFVDSVDYTPYIFVHPQNKQETTDYQLTIDMAKELSMLQRSDKGKQARLYFLELEKKWNDPAQIMARALQMANRTIASLTSELTVTKQQINDMLPAKYAYDTFLTTPEGTYEWYTVNKIFNLPNGHITKLLRSKSILKDLEGAHDKHNTPYAQYKEYFKVYMTKKYIGGRWTAVAKTTVTPKGMMFIEKLLRKEGLIA